MENLENLETNQEQIEQKETATNSSVEELVKSFQEKQNQMQADFEKRLADKDEIIRQLIMSNGKNEPELTDDEKSCQTIIQNINKRR